MVRRDDGHALSAAVVPLSLQIIASCARLDSLLRQWYDLQDGLEALSLAGVVKAAVPSQVYASAISGKSRELKLRVRAHRVQTSYRALSRFSSLWLHPLAAVKPLRASDSAALPMPSPSEYVLINGGVSRTRAL